PMWPMPTPYFCSFPLYIVQKKIKYRKNCTIPEALPRVLCLKGKSDPTFQAHPVQQFHEFHTVTVGPEGAFDQSASKAMVHLHDFMVIAPADLRYIELLHGPAPLQGKSIGLVPTGAYQDRPKGPGYLRLHFGRTHQARV